MKKLLNKKGSVLFLVLVVMSILIVAASATFYIVNNQRSSVQVHYSSEQSYQTAVSISQAVSGYIKGYGTKLKDKQIDGTGYENNILTKLVSLNNGEQFNATQDFSSLEMGNATIEIKKVNEIENEEDKTTEHTYEITTKAEVNGETSTVTEYILLSTGSQVQTAEPFTRFLTSTGKGSDKRDCFLNAASIFGEAFFENEWTMSGAHINCSLYSSKSFVDDGLKYHRPDDCKNWEMVIAKNYLSVANGQYNDGKLDNAFVGGDMTFGSQWYSDKTYINGDLILQYNNTLGSAADTMTYFVKGDCHEAGASSMTNCILYVNGDLYLDRVNMWGTEYVAMINNGNFYVNGKVYYDGVELTLNENGRYTYSNDWGGVSEIANVSPISASEIEDAMANKIPQNNFVDANPDNWSDDDYFEITDWDSVAEYINKKASTNEYMVWDAEEQFLDWETKQGQDGVPTISSDTVVPGSDLELSMNTPVCEITESCRIKQARFRKGGDWGSNESGGNILIHATTEPVYIYLEPEPGETTFTFGQEGYFTNVFIEGEYPVVFILPDGVDFAMNEHSYVGHADIAMQTGGIDSIEDLLQIENVFFNCGFYGGDTARDTARSLFTEDEDGFLKFNTSGNTGTIHNNVFLVSKGDGNTFNFNGQSTFCGYVYAPKCNLTADGATQSVGFIGGIVVSNYSYKCSMAHLIFTSPYDYYNNFSYDTENGENRGDIANKIMSISGGKKPGSDSGNITVVIAVKSLGYK